VLTFRYQQAVTTWQRALIGHGANWVRRHAAPVRVFGLARTPGVIFDRQSFVEELDPDMFAYDNIFTNKDAACPKQCSRNTKADYIATWVNGQRNGNYHDAIFGGMDTVLNPPV
jgi:hypothetical protein